MNSTAAARNAAETARDEFASMRTTAQAASPTTTEEQSMKDATITSLTDLHDKAVAVLTRLDEFDAQMQGYASTQP